MKKYLVLGLFLVTLTALSQTWQRVEIDGAQVCVRDTGEQIPAGYTSPSYSTARCNSFTLFEGWLSSLGIDVAEALTVKMLSDETGLRTTANPNGTGTVQSNCLTGFTCAALGTTTATNFDVPEGAGGDALEINTIVTDGYGWAYKTLADATTDIHISYCADAVAGNGADFSGTTAIIIANGIVWRTDAPVYKAVLAQVGTVRARTEDAAGATTFSGLGTQVGVPNSASCVAIEYDYSADEICRYESSDTKMTWYGVPASDPCQTIADLGSGTGYGIASNNNGAQASYTAQIDDIVVNNTLSITDSGSPPGGGGAPTGGNFSRALFPGQTGGADFLLGIGQSSPDPGTEMATWSTWMGTTADVYVAWHSNSVTPTWADLQDPTTSFHVRNALSNGEFPANTYVIARVPVVPQLAGVSNRNCANPTLWADITAGTHDANITAVAQGYLNYMQAQGFDPNKFILSYGWEMNGQWYPWAICDEADEFKTGWARAVGLWRAVFGNDLVVDISPARNNSVTDNGAACPLSCWLPAATSWDVISKSTHDGWYGGFTVTDQNSWEIQHLSTASPNSVVDLTQISTLAASNNRWMALTEWASQYTDCDPTGSFRASQNPQSFIDFSLGWLDDNKARVAWATWFSPGCTKLHTRQAEQGAINFKAYMSDGVF